MAATMPVIPSGAGKEKSGTQEIRKGKRKSGIQETRKGEVGKKMPRDGSDIEESEERRDQAVPLKPLVPSH